MRTYANSDVLGGCIKAKHRRLDANYIRLACHLMILCGLSVNRESGNTFGP
jgi:hypothetical protein